MFATHDVRANVTGSLMKELSLEQRSISELASSPRMTSLKESFVSSAVGFLPLLKLCHSSAYSRPGNILRSLNALANDATVLPEREKIGQIHADPQEEQQRPPTIRERSPRREGHSPFWRYEAEDRDRV
uniref:Uncharacterized protein n=1 Tax=Steinernema glaseri TaxID=37863 RepID=A0A1I7ZME4_9BILA